MSLTETNPLATLRWLTERRRASGLRVLPIRLADCPAWSMSGGELRHRSGRYFQVIEGSVADGPYAGWRRAMIRQHEIGTLGFIVATEARGEQVDIATAWLTQAKTEPGNVAGTQLAPTVQATESNRERVHGGAPTRHLEWFSGTPPAGRIARDLLASEQGTRFAGKRNRDVAVTVPLADAPKADDAWRWVPSRTLRSLLARDYAVNTDARSVIVSAPWSLLADGGEPFATAAAQDRLTGLLHASYGCADAADAVLAELARRRGRVGWRLEERPLPDPDGEPRATGSRSPWDELVIVEVVARDREVTRWCQPLLVSRRQERCDLYVQVRDGVLRLLFRLVEEPGLHARVELGPSTQSDAGLRQSLPPDAARGVTRLSVLQSDEGGRFMHSVSRYRIVELPPGEGEPPADTIWLTMADVGALSASGGTFTNEARSIISLLLSLA